MLTEDAVRLFLTARKAKGLSPQTLRWYQGILSGFVNMFPELPDKPEQLEEFIASCPAGDERRHGYYRAIKALYRFLKKRYQLPNPVEMCDQPKRITKLPKPLTPQELNDLLAYPHAPKIRAYLLFLADTGARLDELHNVRDYDFSETSYGMTVRIQGKTGPRIVPVSIEVYHAIIEHLPITCSEWWLCRQLSRAFKDARVKGTAHCLRHTFGTLFDGDEMVLQRILGHKHFATTQGYRALRLQKMCEQHSKYSPLRMIMSQTKKMW